MTTVAASCCALLLRNERVRFTSGTRPRVPVVMVGQATQSLLCEVFAKPDLFRGLPVIERRVVAWGREASPVGLPHSAVLVSEEELVARLQGDWRPHAEGAGWTVYATRPLPDGVAEQHFGSRRASAVAVDFEGSSCWVESLENGWLFLIPGWLIAVGGTSDELLAQSKAVSGQIRGTRGEPAGFPAYPRIADPLCGPGWLACGSAAMAFDPICGDGTGNAVREAILASAVIRAAARGEPVEDLLAHYRARLLAGFRRHLELALQFYRSGNGGAWWQGEAAALERGIAWCGGEPEFRYRLDGFDLVRR